MAANSRILDVIQPQIPVFKGESYEFWSIKMKTLLKSHDLWDFVEAGYAESSKDVTSQKENERKDAKALFFIQQAVDEIIFPTISEATSAQQAWLLLRTEYEGGQTEIYEEDDDIHEEDDNIHEMANTDLGDATINVRDVAITVQCLLDSLDRERKNTENYVPCIYMAPNILRDHNPSAFKPRVVSIGPLHKNDKNLQSNERQKATHMFSLLSRLDIRNEVTLKACVHKVHANIDKIRSCYAGTLSYSNAELAKMMVLDGCYILEFLYMIFNQGLWGSALLVESTIYDLILLENQIPYFVLEIIFECTISIYDQEASLINLIRPVLKSVNLFKNHELNIDEFTTCRHILDLLHKCYMHGDTKSSRYSNSRVPSAVELDRAGVNFTRIHDTEWPMVMAVKTRRLPCCYCSWGKPTLIMPILDIDDFTELVFRNLIAYEQISQNLPRYVSSYAIAMDMLIDTEEDVAMLVKSDVIVNHIGSNQEAAEMINNICKEVTWSDFFYNEQYSELNHHYHGYWSRNIAWLRRTYFNNPWNIVALFAGVLLFLLTVVQTIFTVDPRSP